MKRSYKKKRGKTTVTSYRLVAEEILRMSEHQTPYTMNLINKFANEIARYHKHLSISKPNAEIKISLSGLRKEQKIKVGSNDMLHEVRESQK